MENVIGTCENCGGRVITHTMTVRPIPHCENCGYVMKNAYGPTIPMEPKKVSNWDDLIKKINKILIRK